jgi:uncharacterized SAM-binding protein YcdF (DUF218 family)
MRRLVLTLAGLALLIGAVWLARVPLLVAAGRYLIVEDALERSDMIVVLSGGRRDERVRQAAALYRAGYAPRVLLSGGQALMGLPIPDLQRLQALKNGIPDSALLYERTSTSTGEQARFLRPVLERARVGRAIVVTSSFHTRRARYLFRKAFAGSPVQIRVYPVHNDIYSPDGWWTREWDTEVTVLEYIKLGLAVLQ